MNKFLKIILVSAFALSILVLSAPAARALTINEIQAQINAIATQMTALIQQILALKSDSSVSGCSYLWWIDNANIECLSQKQFCGVYMYQGLQTFTNLHDCQNASAEKKLDCVPNWQCGWGPCANGFEPQIPIDENKCGLVITQANIVCPFSTRQCKSSQLSASFTLIDAEASITEYGLNDYIAVGTITFKVKLNNGVMKQFTNVTGSLETTKPMIVINAYDSNGNIINMNSYRYITQAPSKDLISNEEAKITVQQTINFSEKDQIKSMKFKINAINYEANNVLETYSDIGSWQTNLASLPAISQYRLNLMASIAEAIKKISQVINQLKGN